MSAGLSHGLIRLDQQWPVAQQAGVVHGSFEDARKRILGVFAGASLVRRTLDVEEEKRLEEFLLVFGLTYLMALQLAQDEAFTRALNEVRDSLAASGATTEEYLAKISAVATKFGAQGADAASIAKVWMESAIVAPSFASGERHVLQHPSVAGVNPYLQYWTMGDDKVRPRHRALHGFVAATNWEGWRNECQPPIDFNCRCWTVPVPWYVAQQRGWTNTFPEGTEKLTLFRSMAGDSSFPRWMFHA